MPEPSALPERLTPPQQEVVSYPREGGGSLFIRGLAGTGKSTALKARLAALLREGRRRWLPPSHPPHVWCRKRVTSRC